ncbi:SpaA isopeptide-forming pilin-related protein [Gracilibacillus salinarum]|uniref:Ig-like domain-containing protein n=1 Tax=Gracilibacillus salinarum TaxID=2932255 RepID=A0ABY4GR28_9BACI|nr:SpaA isopeptide-forming pilin-related protein [Gracilibacillus salinarum]UOQ86863.1 Ig-like domain-containing protein [Gracilibacillus salinarum]
MVRKISILLICMLMFQTVTSFAVTTQEESEDTATSVFTNVSYTDADGNEVTDITSATSTIQVNVEWSVEDLQIQSGYAESYELPETLTAQGDQQGTIHTEQTEVGTYEVSKEGILTVTFNERIEEQHDAKGEFRFDTVNHKEEVAEEQSPDSNTDEKKVTNEKTQDDDPIATSEKQTTSSETKDTSNIDQSSDNEKVSISSQSMKEESASLASTEITDNIITDVTLYQRFEENGDRQELVPGEEIVVEHPYDKFQVELAYDFALPNNHSYGDGSQYTITVPDQFETVANPEPQPLTTATGTEFGTFVVNNNNEIIITFNENIENNSNISGYISLWSAFDAHYDGAAQEEINFPVSSGGTVTYPIKFKPNASSIDKRGVPDKSYNTDTITWTVDFNKDLQLVENAILDDVTSGDHQFIDGSLHVYELAMNADGTISEEKTTEVTGTFGPAFPFTLGSIDSAYRVVYETSIEDSQGTQYTNTATLDGDNIEPLDASASVSVARGEALEKSATDYNPTTQTTTWEIKYNYDEQSIAAVDALLKDTLGDNQQLVDPSSFEVLEVAINPDTGEETGTTDFTNYTVTDNNDGTFDFQFDQAIDQAYKIRYETTAIDRIEESTTITNTVTDQFEHQADASQSISQQVLQKSNRSTDYNGKATDWQVMLNGDEYTMENVVFTDKLPEGFTPGDIVVEHNGEAWSNGDQYTMNFDASTQTLTITFNQPITNQVYITYKTDIDFDIIDNTKTTFENGAAITWNPEGSSETRTKTGSATFTPDQYTNANGFKGASYHVADKQIDWEIGVNYNNATLDQVVIEDVILDNQNFDMNSIKVYHMTLTGGENGVETGEQLTLGNADNPDEYEVEAFTGPDGEEAFRVVLGDITSPYYITYQTDLHDGLVKPRYDNTATVKSDNREDFNLDASVSPYHGGEYSDKSGSQNNENPRVVNWRVNINYAQSTVSDVTITDTPSANQTLLQDSIKLYDTVATSNDITKGDQLVEGEDYTLEFTEDENGMVTFSLDFPETIDHAYVLEYDTYILYEGDGNISNDFQFDGAETTGLPTNDSVNQAINLGGIGGGIDGEVGSLEVTKVDADNDSPLEGAEFTLYDNTGEQALRTYTTDTDGKVVFQNLLYGEYILKETNAPTGYVTGIANEQTVEVNGDPSSITIENEKIIRDVTLTKVDADTNQPLEGVVFELQDQDGNVVAGYEQLETDEDGKITVLDLDPGSYSFVELEPLFGYHALENPINFTIDSEQTEVKELVAENNIILGAVQLQKLDAENNNTPLADAVFQLEDEEGNKIVRNGQDQFTTYENGIIDIADLRPGTYYFTETEAPQHYQLDATPVEVVVEKNETEPVVVTVSNEWITGSVQLTKKGEDGQLLEGVTFELQDQNGNTIQEGLTTDQDGKVVVTDLKPGLYQFVETKSIPGYQLNDTVEKFEIVKSQPEMLELEFTNALTPGSVELTKIGEEAETLEGAAFKLLDETGNELQIGLVTDDNGVITIDNLKPGNYQLVETKAPFGHELDETPIDFEISFNQQETLELTKENSRTTSSVVLTKQGERGTLLEGVTFELQNEQGETLQTGLMTDENGEILVDDLKPGNYQFVETETIPGYQIDETPVTFEIALGQEESTRVEAINELTTGSVQLTKVGEEAESLSGAEFTLQDEAGEALQSGLITDNNGRILINDLKPGNYQLVETKAPFGHDLNTSPISFTIHFNQQEIVTLTAENSRSTSSVVLTKSGERGNLLEGVEYELQDGAGNSLDTNLVTDKNGELLVDQLKPGNYQLVETASIPGYDLDPTPIAFEIALGQTESTEIEAVNELTTGAVMLRKIGEEGEALANGEFSLLDEEGNVLQTGLTTNENGEIFVDQLKPGSYQFVETKAPFGHVLEEDPISFEIVFNQQEPITVTAENERTTSAVQLTKVDDETGETLAGAVYQISQNGEVIRDNLITDENGQLFVDGLKPGSYQFVETEAPEGYTLDPAPIEFTIDLGQSETLALSTDNAIIKGDFALTKVDFDNPERPLAGVGFELQDADGHIIREDLQTDENGKLLLNDLRPGQYLLVETGPLQGYQAHPAVSFTIGKGQLEAKEITITNKQTRSGVELTKLDRENKDNVLQGATFMLQDEEGNIVAQDLTTDQDGKLIVDGLKPGVYSFIETKAPQGYLLDESPITFTVERGQSTRTEVKAYNQMEQVSSNHEEVEQESSNLPSTATNIFNYILFGGLFMIGGMIVLTMYRRKKQQ